MICFNCERKINENEGFYEIENEIYCNDCIRETSFTYYTVKGFEENTYDMSEVGCYKNKKDFIENINDWIAHNKRIIEIYCKTQDDFSKHIEETARRKIKELQEMKRKVMEEE
ncbi:hypothetical protein [Fusobacterium necrophorum]|uniref:hypothetical protein n=2 Tax=Fusobacterium necrophorum TaxID=859 RepID=UPI00370E0B2C